MQLELFEKLKRHLSLPFTQMKDYDAIVVTNEVNTVEA